MLEHRHAQRTEVEVPVTVYSGSDTELNGRIVNLSADGALIELDTDAFCLRGTVILCFRTYHPQLRSLEWRGFVVRRDATRFAVMFSRRRSKAVMDDMLQRTFALRPRMCSDGDRGYTPLATTRSASNRDRAGPDNSQVARDS
jgi:hypothetical protein